MPSTETQDTKRTDDERNVPDIDGLTDAARRILDAASEAFYWEGIQAVGIDTIIDRAGVARGTLYNNFGSKDELIAAYLQGRHETWLRFLSEVSERGQHPQDRLLAAFDAYGEYLITDGFRGCAFTNAMAELPDWDHPAQVVARRHKESIREQFSTAAAEAGFLHPDTVAARLHLLVEGAWVTAITQRSGGPLADARALAEQLLDTETQHD
ncbi:TetR family transcriptional regulator [Allosaccharopolyspora coralli]|uniref:TetR family transcriptional regulator n=1 Tax=Allosaccharopolyspora coralli TaxID=2665642 RepID=A0A5Q3Q625_9PSEU|nr:TetR/AcrR family transcriptional regulator [Allosaccharopolyspora coralli]QGK69922.1 TetR family transcriptional regulator [Allosaccharopolyspora coralli]